MKKNLFIILFALGVVTVPAEPTGTNAVKISALTAAGSLTGGEYLAMQQGGHGVQSPVATIFDPPRLWLETAVTNLELKITTNTLRTAATNASAYQSNSLAIIATSNALATVRAIPGSIAGLSSNGLAVANLADADSMMRRGTNEFAFTNNSFKTAAQVAALITNEVAFWSGSIHTNTFSIRATNLTFGVYNNNHPASVTAIGSNILSAAGYCQLDMSRGSLQMITITNTIGSFKSGQESYYFRPTNFVAGQSVTVLVLNKSGQTSGRITVADGSYYGVNPVPNIVANYIFPSLMATNYRVSHDGHSGTMANGKSVVINFTAFGTDMTNVFFSAAAEP